tara:strand:- start:436 stop:1584 length:1149 start_codon:yes stop_codon:yes gene_type:complete
MSHDEFKKVNSSPAPEAKKPNLRAAFRNLEPMLAKAKKMLSELPLRPITDKYTLEQVMVRFATSEELQRIVMRCFKGRIIVDTLPVRAGMTPAVVGKVKILTPEGYITLPGSVGSHEFGLGSVDVGSKQMLSAESKSIRRTLRELGLRAEYEEYDDFDNRQNSSSDASSKLTKDDIDDNIEVDDIEVDDIEVDDIEVNDIEVDDIELDDSVTKNVDDQKEGSIPSVPDDAFDLDEQVENDSGNSKTKSAKAKTVATKQKTATASRSKSSGRKTTAKGAKINASSAKKKADAEKKAIELSIPKKERTVKVDREHKQWPDVNSLRYSHELLDALNAVREDLALTVEVMAKSFFGEDHSASRRLSSYTTVELEKMFQFYIIQKAK